MPETSSSLLSLQWIKEEINPEKYTFTRSPDFIYTKQEKLSQNLVIAKSQSEQFREANTEKRHGLKMTWDIVFLFCGQTCDNLMKGFTSSLKPLIINHEPMINDLFETNRRKMKICDSKSDELLTEKQNDKHRELKSVFSLISFTSEYEIC